MRILQGEEREGGEGTKGLRKEGVGRRKVGEAESRKLGDVAD